MIEDIINLRKKGLSFRKIAEELDSTVGKVQYQWTKYVKSNKKNNDIPIKTETKSKQSPQSSIKKPIDLVPMNLEKLPEQIPISYEDCVTTWLISKNKLFVFWKISSQKEKLVSLYFQKPFEALAKVLRIYDVTSLIFNGSNANDYREISLPENKNSWTFAGMKPNRSYCIEWGVKCNEDQFLPLMRSNAIQIPRTNPSQAGELKKEIDRFLQHKEMAPNWIEHVSTYSYYNKEN
ncbi:DUF4912 domain-containing protein [Bacillus sp. 03113]|uniref:DUF4912 domain-containing protein n=1 Tax=Bacillus sp. 03113 TaxID=2578211 RepID=UPI0011415BB3|nr:DUF4912 domain-containing protein [Bacillus sp. 03113]